MTIKRAQSIARLYSQLAALGFTEAESIALRRAEMALHRWGEQECGDGNNFASWAIERDEATGKPFMVTYPHTGKMRRRAIPDREKGALKRVAKIVSDRNTRNWIKSGVAMNDSPGFIRFYHQPDPRGCALYLITREQLGTDSIDSVYTRGLAVVA